MDQWKATYYAKQGNTQLEIGIGTGDSPQKAIKEAQKNPGRHGSRVPFGHHVMLELAELTDDTYYCCIVTFGSDADKEAIRMHKKAARGGGR